MSGSREWMDDDGASRRKVSSARWRGTSPDRPQSLFAERGYDATSVREIVEAAGVAKPTLYYYFRSKEGLAQALTDGPSVRPGRAAPADRHDRIRPDPVHGEGDRGAVRVLPRGSGSGRFIYALLFGPLGSEVAGELEPFKAELFGWTEAAVRRLAEAGVVARDRVDACCTACRGLIVISTLDFLYKRKAARPGPGQPASARDLARFRRWTGHSMAGINTDERDEIERSAGDCSWPRRSLLGLAGCGAAAAIGTGGARRVARPRAIPVTVAPLEHRTIERTVDVIGTLRGWEQVTVGSKRTGRVIKVHHDMGDRVRPGEPLVELDSVDARLAVDQAESKIPGRAGQAGDHRAAGRGIRPSYRHQRGAASAASVADDAIARRPAVVEKT